MKPISEMTDKELLKEFEGNPQWYPTTMILREMLIRLFKWMIVSKERSAQTEDTPQIEDSEPREHTHIYGGLPDKPEGSE